VHDSNGDDFVSHPNDTAHLLGRLESQNTTKSRHAGPVNFIGWFGTHPFSTTLSSGAQTVALQDSQPTLGQLSALLRFPPSRGLRD
jgi:hypothetical protein